MPIYDKIIKQRKSGKPLEYVVTERGCWEPVSHTCKSRDGYTYIRHDGKKQFLHRAVFELECEPLLDGNVVRHSCDNPTCFNPAHLSQGTQKDNMADMKSRGRSYDKSGSSNPRAKLSDRDVYEIKHLLKHGIFDGAELGRIYGVHKTQIYKIRDGKRFSHIVV